MKQILSIILASIALACQATDNAYGMYGTADKPQINGEAYDVHKPYIEPNQGYHMVKSDSGASTEPQMAIIHGDENVNHHVVVHRASAQTATPVNFGDASPRDASLQSDSWANDSSVEKMLKQAASDGKLSYVLDQAKKANLPASVAVVPMVESNYNKTAVSPKGAGGAWQLMPGTAGDYGLSPDDRFDFISSTNVAIQLLNDLHQQFGNWALALAAYNCGAQCVTNALKKNPGATDIDDLNLPKETRNYVHKIVQYNQMIARLDNKTIN